jgi:hypothetical protein
MQLTVESVAPHNHLDSVTPVLPVPAEGETGGQTVIAGLKERI